ncbi:heme exporter protein CcmD [Thiorhodospira sibirica]|uniref:heme exporter protein CcmD n=1 Tax=Thiorhodospira sibirica TaxID=154347 RepID=UPI00022C2860|nr:heme exporter protein CcmD [Thiorhodospira sibirica]
MPEFLQMGVHAPYVWGAYGVAALLLIGEILFLYSRRKAVTKRLQRMARLIDQEKKDNETTY